MVMYLESISWQWWRKDIASAFYRYDISVAGDAIWTRTSETGVTRKAWKVPVTSATILRISKQTMNC